MNKYSEDDIVWREGGGHHGERKENPVEHGELEPDASHRIHHNSSDSELHPLKREVKLHKSPVQDFGTSLCMLHGDIFVTDVRKNRCVGRFWLWCSSRFTDAAV
jgi:hypothetical protein